MRNFGREKRNKIYKLALKLYMEAPHSGMCWHIMQAYAELFPKGDFLFFSTMKKHFPELYEYKPEDKHELQNWFPFDSKGKKMRVWILKQCIQETKRKRYEKANCDNQNK